MSEGFFTIELGRYGFMIDTAWCYIALSWELLATTTILILARRIYIKRKKNK